MDKQQEQMRMEKIFNGLEKQLNEQANMEPIINKIADATNKALSHVFRVYRTKCKESFEDLEKYANIDVNANIILKDPKNQEKYYGAVHKVLDCIYSNDKEFERVNKSFYTETERLFGVFDNCILKCSENSDQRSDKEISDCFQNCHKEHIDLFKGMSKMITDDFTSVVNRIEKL